MRYRRSTTAGGTYFFTVVTDNRRPWFSDTTNVELLTSAVASTRQRRPFELDAYVVLPDHLHMIWTLPERDADFATRWRLIKERFTKQIVKRQVPVSTGPARRARGEQAVWQRRYWEHLIRDDRDFQNHVDYVHHNPVRHGLVSAPADWLHSSFSDWVARGVYQARWTLEADSMAHKISTGE